MNERKHLGLFSSYCCCTRLRLYQHTHTHTQTRYNLLLSWSAVGWCLCECVCWEWASELRSHTFRVHATWSFCHNKHRCASTLVSDSVCVCLCIERGGRRRWRRGVWALLLYFKFTQSSHAVIFCPAVFVLPVSSHVVISRAFQRPPFEGEGP